MYRLARHSPTQCALMLDYTYTVPAYNSPYNPQVLSVRITHQDTLLQSHSGLAKVYSRRAELEDRILGQANDSSRHPAKA